MIKPMVLPWVVPSLPCLPIFLWVTMRNIGYKNTTAMKFFSIADMWTVHFAYSTTTVMPHIFHQLTTYHLEKEENHKLPFLDVLIDNSHPDFLVTSVFRKKTHTGLLTNFFSFTPFSCKIGLLTLGMVRLSTVFRLG